MMYYEQVSVKEIHLLNFKLLERFPNHNTKKLALFFRRTLFILRNRSVIMTSDGFHINHYFEGKFSISVMI